MTNLDIFVIDYELSNINPNWWIEITNLFLKVGENFKATLNEKYISYFNKDLVSSDSLEIHLENNLIEVSGNLSEQMILNFYKNYRPYFNKDIDLYCEFYSLKIGKNYCSAHHGSQIYLTNLSNEVLGKVEKIILPLSDFLQIYKSW